jgi:hypothetical protein
MAERKRRRAYWLIGLVLAVAALIGGAYAHLTNPARLRGAALQALHVLPFDGIDVGRVTFSPRGRLELTDVVISPPRAGPFYRRPVGLQMPPLLCVGSIQIDCRWAELLLGRLRPTHIELRRVSLAVVCDPASPADKASAARVDADARLLWHWLSAAGNELPAVAIQQADVQVFVVERGAPQLVQRMLLRAAGQSTASGYGLRVDHRPAKDAPLAELRWNQPAGEWTLTMDWIDLKTISRFLPPNMAGSIAQLGLGGRARLERLGVHWPSSSQPGHPARAALGPVELRLADLRCALPLEEDEAGLAPVAHPGSPTSCFLQLVNGAGTLTYRPAGPTEPEECEAAVQGRLRGAPTTFHMRILAAPLWHFWTTQRTAPDENAAARLSLEDVLQAELRIDGLELPTAETYPAFVRSPRLTGPVVAALRDYRPRGKVNLRLGVRPPDAIDEDGTPLVGAARIEGEIEASGAACRYKYFPYDFADIWGTLRLAHGRILLEQLTGRHGIGRVRADGVVHSSRSWTGFDLQFRSQNIALDADLYAALPESYRRLWQQASPLGLCDVVTTVGRLDGSAETGPLTANVQVAADLLSGSLSLGGGRRLDHADGRLRIQDGVVHLENLHGYDGSAGVRLDGEIRMVDGTTCADLRVEVSDLPIEHTAILAAGPADSASQVRFVGHADVWGRVHGSPHGGERGESLAVHVKDGELNGQAPAQPWHVRDGWIRVQDGSREILALTCEQDRSRLDLSGTLPRAADSGEALSLTLRAQTTAIEDLYPQFVPSHWRRRIDELGLTGTADLQVALRTAPAGDCAGQQVAEITLAAAQMQPRPLPLELRNVTAEVTLAPGRFRVTRAAADWGPEGHIRVQQGADGAWHADQLEAEFDIAAQNMVLGPELLRALPGAAPQLLEKLGLQGECDVLLPSVRVTGGAQRTWQIAGRLPLRNVALQLGLDLDISAGELSGVCNVLPEGDVELSGHFGITRGQLAGRPIERWQGVIQRAAGAPWVQLANVQGQLCDGTVQGTVQIDPHSSDYELALELRDVSVDEILPRPKTHPERPRRGRLAGEVWLRGTGNDATSRRGGGDLLITGATFLQMPVLASVLRLGAQPARDVVDQARIRFRWEGREIVLEQVTIESQDLRLVGTGTWNMRDDTIRMTLWAARPELWPRLEALDKVLELAGQELMQYRVEGTLSAPKVTAQPLHRINETLRRLLGEQ